MIRFATEKESEQIVSLWQEAFGDSREWVLLYLEENIENVLIYEENGQVFGMLSLLRVSYKERAGFYVYGVATGKAHRSLGVSTKLLEHAKKLAGDGFLVLVPRNQGLFEFYKGRGFFPVNSVTTTEMAKADAKCGCRVLPATPGEYYQIRKNKLENLIEWDEDMLCSIRKFENGKYYKTDDGDGAFCYAYDGVLYVKELLGGEDMVGSIVREYEVDRVRVTYAVASEFPSCMTWPEFEEKVFFNISID